jgi:hypothetical protein
MSLALHRIGLGSPIIGPTAGGNRECPEPRRTGGISSFPHRPLGEEVMRPPWGLALST